MQVKHLLLIAILALTAACSSKEVVDENLSEVELYQQAQTDLDNNSYTSATAKLKALESRYPFGRYADQAQLELIYANYKNAEPEAAKSAADRWGAALPTFADRAPPAPRRSAPSPADLPAAASACGLSGAAPHRAAPPSGSPAHPAPAIHRAARPALHRRSPHCRGTPPADAPLLRCHRCQPPAPVPRHGSARSRRPDLPLAA